MKAQDKVQSDKEFFEKGVDEESGATRAPSLTLTIVFIVLVALAVLSFISISHYLLGAMGFLRFAYIDPGIEFVFNFITCSGPLLVTTLFISRFLHKKGGKPLAVALTTTAIVASLVSLIGYSDFRGKVALILAISTVGIIVLGRRGHSAKATNALRRTKIGLLLLVTVTTIVFIGLHLVSQDGSSYSQQEIPETVLRTLQSENDLDYLYASSRDGENELARRLLTTAEINYLTRNFKESNTLSWINWNIVKHDREPMLNEQFVTEGVEKLWLSQSEIVPEEFTLILNISRYSNADLAATEATLLSTAYFQAGFEPFRLDLYEGVPLPNNTWVGFERNNPSIGNLTGSVNCFMLTNYDDVVIGGWLYTDDLVPQYCVQFLRHMLFAQQEKLLNQ